MSNAGRRGAMTAIIITVAAEVVPASAVVTNSFASMIRIQPITPTVTVSVAGVV